MGGGEVSTLERRYQLLRGRMSEHIDMSNHDMLFVQVICDNCGRALRWNGEEDWSVIDKFFSGWNLSESQPYHDLCPACAC